MAEPESGIPQFALVLVSPVPRDSAPFACISSPQREGRDATLFAYVRADPVPICRLICIWRQSWHVRSIS